MPGPDLMETAGEKQQPKPLSYEMENTLLRIKLCERNSFLAFSFDIFNL